MIQWGIIGLGNIARRFADALALSDVGHLYAGASHNDKKRKYFQEKYNIKTYDDYEDLLNDQNIDAIYIALPHGCHYQWAKAALNKNKAVLCEKPVTLSLEQLDELIELSRQKQTFFMEAMKTRFIPMTKQIQKIIDDKVLGDVERVETSFCNDVPYHENSYLFDKQQGGILFDCGIYNIASILQFIESDVKDIQGRYVIKYDVDVDDEIELVFESKQTARIECSMIQNKDKVMKIYGTLGTLTCSPFYRPQEVLVEFKNGESLTGQLSYEKDNDFYSEIEEVHRCLGYIKIESPLMTHQDSRRCIELMLKIKEKMV